MRIVAGKTYRCREGHAWRATGRTEAIGKSPNHTILHEVRCIQAFAFSPQDGVDAHVPPLTDYLTQSGFWYISEVLRSSRDMVQEVKAFVAK